MVVSVVVLAGIVVFVSWNRTIPDEPRVDSPQVRKSEIIYYLNENAGYGFSTHISLVEQLDSEGNPYFVGKLEPEMDALLAPLVGTYNADPSTLKLITVEEVKYSLTEGITEVTAKGSDDSVFFSFLCWCGSTADLVYGEDYYINDELKHLAGDSAYQEGVTNFSFIFGRDGPIFAGFKFSWE